MMHPVASRIRHKVSEGTKDGFLSPIDLKNVGENASALNDFGDG